jgi:hypothetical protein
MRPDHTATDVVQTQPLLATPEGVDESVPQRQQVNVLARVTFGFAWLFGLEPFLATSGDNTPRSRPDRH